MYQTEALTLFIDLGTNGEVVLGNNQWLMAAAASAGPAFEGGGISMGMSFAPGAIVDCRIDHPEADPFLTVLGGEPVQGICGSGLLALLSNLLRLEILEPGGRLSRHSGCPRLQEGDNGWEYVLRREGKEKGPLITVNEADIQNLLRAKGAIYAACATLLDMVDLRAADIERVLLAGSFGSALNLDHAIRIGLLPELPAERFRYVGNSSLRGARLAALNSGCLPQAEWIKASMTLLELSDQPRYMDNYTAALFFPHTQAESLFPRTWREMKMRDYK
jgi:uncharacterized 2Fe-2S/4Fe-4S cluster protein (DUF4445 family)